MKHQGRCHCGAIRVRFETERPLAPRACQCRFCRMHGARSVSDPEGRAALTFDRPPLLYRFASRAADYVLCSVCGAYAGAMTGEEGGRIGTLNLNLFLDPRPDLEAIPVSYEGETSGAKAARRRERWTPLTVDA